MKKPSVIICLSQATHNASVLRMCVVTLTASTSQNDGGINTKAQGISPSHPHTLIQGPISVYSLSQHNRSCDLFTVEEMLEALLWAS